MADGFIVCEKKISITNDVSIFVYNMLVSCLATIQFLVDFLKQFSAIVSKESY